MTTEPFIPVNLYSLEPREQEEVWGEVQDEIEERYHDDLKELLKKGTLFFYRARAKDRLAWYMEQTLPADLPLVLDPDYLEKRRLGAALPLQAELMRKEREAAQAEQEAVLMQAQVMGIVAAPEMPPLPPDAPPFWPGWLEFPDLMWGHFARDFRDLLDAARDKH